MFGKMEKRAQGKRHRIGQRLPILRAGAILADRRYRFYISQVKKLADLPDEHFDQFYWSLIERFVEFVQAFPENTDGFLGSMATSGLLRALNVLHVFVTEFDAPGPLERFALFSACLLQQIEQIVTRAKVFITAEDGATTKIWQPFSGTLLDEAAGESYKIIPLVGGYQRMEAAVRISLARQLVGEPAFLSIANDSSLLMEWFEALLDEDREGFLRLQKVLKAYRSKQDNLMDDLVFDIEVLESPATEHADAFLEWLREGLQNNSIKVNTADAHVHVAGSGFIVEEGLFEIFAQRYNRALVKGFVVSNQFDVLVGKAGLKTDVLAVSGEKKSTFSNPFAKKAETTVKQGVLVTDSKLVTTHEAQTTHRKLPANIKNKVHVLAVFNEAKQEMTPKYR